MASRKVIFSSCPSCPSHGFGFGSRRYVPGFLIQSLRSALQAKRAAGNLAVSILRNADPAFWIRTVWLDEAAMRSFMQSGVHRRVMVRLPTWCGEAAVVHWVQQDIDQPPSWAEAHQRLQREAGVRGSVTYRRRSAGLRSGNRGQAAALCSSDGSGPIATARRAGPEPPARSLSRRAR